MSDETLQILLAALADIRRLQIVEMKLSPHTESVHSDAYVYAIQHSIYPINDEASLDRGEHSLLRKPFQQSYSVPFEQVHEVAKLLDEKWRTREKITFYDVETPYRTSEKNWRGGNPRSDLIHICRYLFLSDLFDQEFWTQFMSDHPVEASHVTDPWTRGELLALFEA